MRMPTSRSFYVFNLIIKKNAIYTDMIVSFKLPEVHLSVLQISIYMPYKYALCANSIICFLEMFNKK